MQSEAFELIDRFEKAVDANGYRTRDRHTEEEYRAALAALEAALSAAEPQPEPSVAVKALEWDEFSTELKRHFQSNTILGQYQIAYLGEFECWQLYSPQKSSTWKENFSRHKSSDEAKAAAQADYEARIRSALSAQVQDVSKYEYRLVTKEGREYAQLNATTDEEAQAINDNNFAGRLKVERRVVPEWEAVAAPAKKEGGHD